MTTGSKGQTDRVRALSVSILKLAVGHEPREYMAALAIASAMFIKTWPKEKHLEVFRAHIRGIRKVMNQEV